jgi:hypothetical protein
VVCATGLELTLDVWVAALDLGSLAAITPASAPTNPTQTAAATTRPRVPNIRCAILAMVTDRDEAVLKQV